MTNDFANFMIVIGIVWTLAPIILRKQMIAQAKPIFIFSGVFCLGIAFAIYIFN